MTMTADPFPSHAGASPAAQPDVAAMLAAGRLPDAPMTMPTQRLEAALPRFAFLRALVAGPLRSAGT